MKEYYADIVLTREIEEWLLVQGATVSVSDAVSVPGYEVMFGHRKIHFYAGSDQVRIFFNEDNVSASTLLLLMWPKSVLAHNLPEDIYII